MKYVLVYGTVAVAKNRVLSWKAACVYEWRACAGGNNITEGGPYGSRAPVVA